MADQAPPSSKRMTLNQLGCRVSEWASDFAAQPFAQLGLLIFCIGWFALKLPTDLLTAALSILAITLTQMVLNRQNQRERDAHQRDVAMHAKLDELVHASKRARDEMAGIEDLPEEKIAELKENALQNELAASRNAPAGDRREQSDNRTIPREAHKKTAARFRAAAFSGSLSD